MTVKSPWSFEAYEMTMKRPFLLCLHECPRDASRSFVVEFTRSRALLRKSAEVRSTLSLDRSILRVG
jgi:hypothetical protein